MSAELAISLKHNIGFAKFLEIVLENNVTSSLQTFVDDDDDDDDDDDELFLWYG